MGAHRHGVRGVTSRAVPFTFRQTRFAISRDTAPQSRERHLRQCQPHKDGTAAWPYPDTSDAAPQQTPSAARKAADALPPSSEGFPSKLDADIFKMAVPSFCAVIMDPLLGMVDTAIVGQLGGQVLAGAQPATMPPIPSSPRSCDVASHSLGAPMQASGSAPSWLAH